MTNPEEQVLVPASVLAALMEQANGDPNGIGLPTLRMTDLELEAIANAYEEIVRTHPGMSAGFRTWYVEAARGCRSTLHWREGEQRDMQRANGLPRTWAEAVAALEPEEQEQGGEA